MCRPMGLKVRSKLFLRTPSANWIGVPGFRPAFPGRVPAGLDCQKTVTLPENRLSLG